MYIIAGLGNTGAAYKDTRHNAGRIAVAAWVEKRGGSFVSSSKYQGDIWEGVVEGEEVLALLPATYMNESGGSIQKAVSKGQEERLMVLYDDLDLPLGAIRVSFDRGAGGHNGVRSVMDALGTGAFIRIRIGISTMVDGAMHKPQRGAGVLQWVLGAFKKHEHATLQEASAKAGEAIEHIVKYGYKSAMNAFN